MAVDVKLTDNSEQFKDALKDQVERALIAIGAVAESRAKQYCPVDTGRLRNSITNAVLEDEEAVIIGTNVEYAPYVELGTTRMKARPYLRPAIENHTSEYKSLIKQFMGGK